MHMEASEHDAYLAYYITHLIRIWTALGIIRKAHGDEVTEVFKDLCSDKLRVMSYELASPKTWTVGFSEDGSDKHKRLFSTLTEANKWFTATKNSLHARNMSGSHLQPLDRAEHMFQQFGYGGEREWRHLTKGVAACLGMMQLIQGHKHRHWWRRIRKEIRTNERKPIPPAIDALLIDFG